MSFSNTLTAEPPLSPCIPAKRLVPACCAPYCATLKCPWMNSSNSSSQGRVPSDGAFDFSWRGPSGVFTFNLKLLTFNLPSPLPFPQISTILSNPTPPANPFPPPTCAPPSQFPTPLPITNKLSFTSVNYCTTLSFELDDPSSPR